MPIQTYPEMNEKIGNLLRLSDAPDKLYAAQRIEELETALRDLGETLQSMAKQIEEWQEHHSRLLVVTVKALDAIHLYAADLDVRDELDSITDEETEFACRMGRAK